MHDHRMFIASAIVTCTCSTDADMHWPPYLLREATTNNARSA